MDNEVLASVIPEEYDLVLAAGVAYYEVLDQVLTEWRVLYETDKHIDILFTCTVEVGD